MRLALWLACLLVGCASPRVAVVELAPAPSAHALSGSPRGLRVRFEGNHEVSRDRLLDAVKGGDPERDASSVLGVYWDLGYVRARLDAPVVAGNLTVYRIHEGRRYRVGRVSARDVDAHGAPLATPDGLPTLAHLHAHAGDWFSRGAWAVDVEAVKALYRDVGYPLVDVRIDTKIDDADDTVDVTLTGIDLGPRVTIDAVEVVAPSADDEAFARARIDVKAAELYDASKIEAARKRLVATGRWADVNVSYGGIPIPFPPTAKVYVHFALEPR